MVHIQRIAQGRYQQPVFRLRSRERCKTNEEGIHRRKI